MDKSSLCWLLVTAAAGATAFFAAAGWFEPAKPAADNRDPLIEYPAKLDLGDREIGELAIMPFTIANRGGRELVVDHINSNCSCTGMERQEGDRFARFEILKLAPGEEAKLVLRVSVRGVPPGTAMYNSVSFRTNDPGHPEGAIEAKVRRVSAGVYTTPKSVSFQTVSVGSTVRQVLDVRDTAIRPRSIAWVSSTDPDRVTARLLAVVEGAPPGKDQGTIIGRIAVVVGAERPGLVNAAVQIHLAGEMRSPDEIPVLGRVSAAIEIAPSSLFLPRRSADGPVYSAMCVCRNTSLGSLALDVVAAPPDLAVEFLGDLDTSSRIFRVTWRPDRTDFTAGSQRRLIRLKAREGEHESFLDLPVTVTK